MPKLLKGVNDTKFKRLQVIPNVVRIIPTLIKINRVPYKEKVCFLYEQAYKFYCDYHKMRIGDSVDIHYHFYARRDALRAVLDVMKNKRISACFRKRVTQLIRWERFYEVEYLGVL